MTESSADPLSPKCVQSTAGAVLSLWMRKIRRYLDVTGSLRKDGYKLISTVLDGGAEPSVLECQSKLLLALGNEAAGLSPEILEISDYRVGIPINREKAESLNVAACGAACMYLSSKNS